MGTKFNLGNTKMIRADKQELAQLSESELLTLRRFMPYVNDLIEKVKKLESEVRELNFKMDRIKNK